MYAKYNVRVYCVRSLVRRYNMMCNNNNDNIRSAAAAARAVNRKLILATVPCLNRSLGNTAREVSRLIYLSRPSMVAAVFSSRFVFGGPHARASVQQCSLRDTHNDIRRRCFPSRPVAIRS